MTSSGGLEGFPLSAGKGGGLTNRNRVFFPDEDEMKAAMRGIAANPGIGRTGVDAPFASAKYKLDRGRWPEPRHCVLPGRGVGEKVGWGLEGCPTARLPLRNVPGPSTPSPVPVVRAGRHRPRMRCW